MHSQDYEMVVLWLMYSITAVTLIEQSHVYSWMLRLKLVYVNEVGIQAIKGTKTTA